MQTKRFCFSMATIAGIASLISAVAFGAGFEKNILFSGKYAGRAGAGVTNDLGAEALFFNPSGLAAGRTGIEVTGNFDPTWGHFEGPLTQPNVNVSGNSTFDPLYGVFASYNITEHWGVGVGTYVGAGAHSEFNNSTFANPTPGAPGSVSTNAESDIFDQEVSVGTGYEVLSGLRIGAAWRLTHVSSTFNSFAYSPSTATIEALNFSNMGQWRYNGFRVGGQYTAPDNSWGLGVDWRTPVNFNLSGNFAGTYSNPLLAGGAAQTISAVPATLGATLPTQVTVGGNYEFLPKTLRGYLEYVWTQYHTDSMLAIGATPTIAGTPIALPNVPLGFSNQTNVRVALECTAVPNWVYRVGYVWTSQVTPNDLATTLLEPPAHGNTITLGTGTQLIPDALEVNGAFEYDWVDGYGNNPSAAAGLPGLTSAGTLSNSGEYTAKAYVLHIGATLRL